MDARQDSNKTFDNLTHLLEQVAHQREEEIAHEVVRQLHCVTPIHRLQQQQQNHALSLERSATHHNAGNLSPLHPAAPAGAAAVSPSSSLWQGSDNNVGMTLFSDRVGATASSSSPTPHSYHDQVLGAASLHGRHPVGGGGGGGGRTATTSLSVTPLRVNNGAGGVSPAAGGGGTPSSAPAAGVCRELQRFQELLATPPRATSSSLQFLPSRYPHNNNSSSSNSVGGGVVPVGPFPDGTTTTTGSPFSMMMMAPPEDDVNTATTTTTTTFAPPQLQLGGVTTTLDEVSWGSLRVSETAGEGTAQQQLRRPPSSFSAPSPSDGSHQHHHHPLLGAGGRTGTTVVASHSANGGSGGRGGGGFVPIRTSSSASPFQMHPQQPSAATMTTTSAGAPPPPFPSAHRSANTPVGGGSGQTPPTAPRQAAFLPPSSMFSQEYNNNSPLSHLPGNLVFSSLSRGSTPVHGHRSGSHNSTTSSASLPWGGGAGGVPQPQQAIPPSSASFHVTNNNNNNLNTMMMTMMMTPSQQQQQQQQQSALPQGSVIEAAKDQGGCRMLQRFLAECFVVVPAEENDDNGGNRAGTPMEDPSMHAADLGNGGVHRRKGAVVQVAAGYQPYLSQILCELSAPILSPVMAGSDGSTSTTTTAAAAAGTVSPMMMTALPELMSDPYGNFFVQRLFEVGDDVTRRFILEGVAPFVRFVANTPHGTFAVQKLVESVATRVTSVVKQQQQQQQQPRGATNKGESMVPVPAKGPTTTTTKTPTALRYRDDNDVRSPFLPDHADIAEEPAWGEMEILCRSLSPDIATLCCDPNGGHVILKILQVFQPLSCADFLFVGLLQSFAYVANHKQGCCVVQKALDYANEAQFGQLEKAILEHLRLLIDNPYGNYVVSHWVDVAHRHYKASRHQQQQEQQPQQQQPSRVEIGGVDAAAHILAPVLFAYCFNKYSSNVVEKILRHCEADAKLALCEALLSGRAPSVVGAASNNNSPSHHSQPEAEAEDDDAAVLQHNNMLSLATHAFSNYVLQTALSIAPPLMFERLCAVLDTLAPMLSQHNIGRKVLARAEAVKQQQQLQQTVAGAVAPMVVIGTAATTTELSSPSMGHPRQRTAPSASSPQNHHRQLFHQSPFHDSNGNNSNSGFYSYHNAGGDESGALLARSPPYPSNHLGGLPPTTAAVVGPSSRSPHHAAGGASSSNPRLNRTTGGHTPHQHHAGSKKSSAISSLGGSATTTAALVGGVNGEEKPSGCYWPLSPPHLQQQHSSLGHPEQQQQQHQQPGLFFASTAATTTAMAPLRTPPRAAHHGNAGMPSAFSPSTVPRKLLNEEEDTPAGFHTTAATTKATAQAHVDPLASSPARGKGLNPQSASWSPSQPYQQWTQTRNGNTNTL